METLAVLFLILIMAMAFWILTFLVIFIFGWLVLGIIEKINPRLAYAFIGYYKGRDPAKEN